MDNKQSQNKKNNSGRQEVGSKKGNSSYSNEAQNRRNGTQCSDSTDGKNCKD